MLNPEDTFTLDDTVFRVNSVHPDGFWAHSVGDTYYWMRWISLEDYNQYYKEGRIRKGHEAIVTGGNKSCWHKWKRYRGLHKVVDCCACGAEKPVYWRDLKDETDS